MALCMGALLRAANGAVAGQVNHHRNRTTTAIGARASREPIVVSQVCSQIGRLADAKTGGAPAPFFLME